MTTPTFPDLPPNTETGTLAPAIDAIVGGDFSRSRLAAFSDLDRNRAAYLRAHWLDIPETERHALMLALAEIGDQSLEFNFNRVYRVALNDPNPVVRQLAIVDLWEDDGRDLPPVYVRMLQTDPSDDVRAVAAEALSVACDAIADGDSDLLDRDALIELFSRLIEDSGQSSLIRRSCLVAVGALGFDPRVTDLIRLGLDDDDQMVVAGAVYAMGRTASESWTPELLDFLRSEDAELRFEASRAAGLLGDMDTVPELADLVYDVDLEVRAAALAALGSIGGPAAIRVLREAGQDEEFEEEEIIDEALDEAHLTVDPLEWQS